MKKISTILLAYLIIILLFGCDSTEKSDRADSGNLNIVTKSNESVGVSNETSKSDAIIENNEISKNSSEKAEEDKEDKNDISSVLDFLREDVLKLENLNDFGGEKMNIQTVVKGDTISIHYKGSLENGDKFDSSYDRGEPIKFTVGQGRMIPGFEKGVMGMKEGEKRTLTLTPDEAYGKKNEELIFSLPRENFNNLPPEYKPGDYIYVETQQGPMEANIVELNEDTIVLDFNPRLAGKTLIFEVELVEIK